MALALAAVGVYGITAHLVTRRTGEIGVRMAMGACPVDVMELVMRQCVTLILPGLGIGTVLSFGLARAFQKMLYGVSETDLEPSGHRGLTRGRRLTGQLLAGTPGNSTGSFDGIATGIMDKDRTNK